MAMTEEEVQPLWPMPEGLRAKVLERLEAVVSDPRASHRTVIMVGKVVVKLEEQEQAHARVEALKRRVKTPSFAEVVSTAEKRYELRKRNSNQEERLEH
jgi:hypothetical protein